MTSTPPRDMAPETKDPLLRLVQTWRQMAEENPSGVDAAGAYFGAADDLRAVMDSFDEPVETVEYRVTTTRPDGEQVEFAAADFQAQFWAEHGGTEGWPPAVVECRTVTTVTSRSGWRPVDTGGER